MFIVVSHFSWHVRRRGSYLRVRWFGNNVKHVEWKSSSHNTFIICPWQDKTIGAHLRFLRRPFAKWRPVEVSRATTSTLNDCYVLQEWPKQIKIALFFNVYSIQNEVSNYSYRKCPKLHCGQFKGQSS